MATALLPHEKISEAVSLIETFALTTSDIAKTIRLVAYFKREWIGVVTAKSFSVFGQSERTNNCQESLNRCINRTITPQGNTWDFWNGIRAVSVKEINYFHQLREGRKLWEEKEKSVASPRQTNSTATSTTHSWRFDFGGVLRGNESCHRH